MKILLLISFLAAASAQCPGVYINGTYYDVDIIKENLTGVVALTFDRLHNTAYYTYNKDGANTLEYVKLHDKSTGTIDIVDPAGIAVDHFRNYSKLYIGTPNGLYELKLEENEQPKHVNISANHDIRNIFTRKHQISFVDSNKKAFNVLGGHFPNIVQEVYELGRAVVEKFINDNAFNIHFLANNKVGKVKRTTGFYYYPKTDLFVNDIAENPKFVAYICGKDGIYIYYKYADADKYEMDKVADINDIKKIAFVSDDEPIYVVNDTLVKLTKSTCIL